jgi:predicted transcriptional regulator
MAVGCSFLTNHARALLYIASEPDALLRTTALELGVTERTAHGIVADLTEAGYIVKHRDGRRNRYDIRTDVPIPDRIVPPRTIDEVLALLTDIGEQ